MNSEILPPHPIPGRILPNHRLAKAIKAQIITARPNIEPIQIQPASLDLRLGQYAWRVAASFLPGEKNTVADMRKTMAMHKIDLTNGAVLERGCVYIIKLSERLSLPPKIEAKANPKSTTGRLDVFARLITDNGASFDLVRAGYSGPLYAEISPRTFSIRVSTGARLLQLRLRITGATEKSKPRSDVPVSIDLTGDTPYATSKGRQKATLSTNPQIQTDLFDSRPHLSSPLTRSFSSRRDHSYLVLHNEPKQIIGWRARKHAGLVDIAKIATHPILDFWEPVFATKKGYLILDPDDFYILATREEIIVKPREAAEMLAYDTSMGEFRVHYAGFFDPGFGDKKTSHAVLEVRTHETPFLINEGQIVAHLVYENLLENPDIVYGDDKIGSSYQGQKLKLAKQFATR